VTPNGIRAIFGANGLGVQRVEAAGHRHPTLLHGTTPAVVLLVAVVVAVSAAARRFGLLAPILLVIVGLLLSFVPGFPVPQIDPRFVITAVLPPLLYVAALETSVPAFKYNLRPILLLAVGHVLFIAAVVASPCMRCCRRCRWRPVSPSAPWSRRRTRSPPPR
jgi:hypothetical protein